MSLELLINFEIVIVTREPVNMISAKLALLSYIFSTVIPDLCLNQSDGGNTKYSDCLIFSSLRLQSAMISPLMIASSKGFSKVVGTLLTHGANGDGTDTVRPYFHKDDLIAPPSAIM